MATGKAFETDPTRALELLWAPRDRPRRGPKPGLDLDRIVQAAIAVADREDLQALSMRRVAAELGVGTASLYTYVPGRDELIALMLDTVAGYSTLPHTMPGNWRAKLEAWAREDWAEFHRHPWVPYVVSGRLVPGPNALAWYDSALRVLGDTGLSEAEKAAVIDTIDGYVRGLAWASANSIRAERTTGVSDAIWDARRAAAMAKLVDFERYPALARALVAGVSPGSTDTFEIGLQRVLDGIEALIVERQPP